MQIGTISISEINTYQICARRYYYQYICELPTTWSAPLAIGIGFHNARKVNNVQKISTRQDLPVDTVLDIFSTEYDEADIEYTASDNPGKLKDSGIAILEKYHTEVAPSIQPIEAEEKFYMSFSNRHFKFTGRIDVASESGFVIDTKTTGTNYKKPRLDHWLQIVGYTTAIRRKGILPKVEGRIDYAVRKATPLMNCYPVIVTESDEGYFLSVMDGVARAIELEVWTPNRSAMLCSRRYCSFWGQCEEDCKGTVKK